MIYVHVPFCRRFCTYCDFYSELCTAGAEAYVDELLNEVERRRGEIASTLEVNTLYIGGGTPSVLPSALLGRIVHALGDGPWEEFTVEVNPDDITPQYAADLRALGVNRISMGVQSLDDGVLKWMNRRHDAAGALRAFRTLREAGFDNISVDVIFGLNPSVMPMQAFVNTLQEVIEMRPEHISAYQLSVEEGSALGALVRSGRYTEADDSLCAEQYAMLCSQLAAAGYGHYEVSNWALEGREARHNSAYWTRAPYVGLGPGAHSLSADGLVRSWNPESLTGWSQQGEELDGGLRQGEVIDGGSRQGEVLDGGLQQGEVLTGQLRRSEELTADQVRTETIMLGLRTSRGIPLPLLGPSAAPLLRDGSLVLLPEGAFVSGDSHVPVPDGRVVPLPEDSGEADYSFESLEDALHLPGSAALRVRIPEDRFFVSDSIILRALE